MHMFLCGEFMLETSAIVLAKCLFACETGRAIFLYIYKIYHQLQTFKS